VSPSEAHGPNISLVEVTNISPHGFWLFIGERELFVAFRNFPWFRDASIRAITSVELPSPPHLHWPELDVDLAVESIEHPERYPLISELQSNMRLQPTTARERPLPKPRASAARSRPKRAR
jgi:hypothetical protein